LLTVVYNIFDYLSTLVCNLDCCTTKMDSHFRENDPGKARLYGAGIKGRGSGESNPYILVMTGGEPVYFNISLNNKTFISFTFVKDVSLVINISAFASKEVAI